MKKTSFFLTILFFQLTFIAYSFFLAQRAIAQTCQMLGSDINNCNCVASDLSGCNFTGGIYHEVSCYPVSGSCINCDGASQGSGKYRCSYWFWSQECGGCGYPPPASGQCPAGYILAGCTGGNTCYGAGQIYVSNCSGCSIASPNCCCSPQEPTATPGGPTSTPPPPTPTTSPECTYGAWTASGTCHDCAANKMRETRTLTSGPASCPATQTRCTLTCGGPTATPTSTPRPTPTAPPNMGTIRGVVFVDTEVPKARQNPVVEPCYPGVVTITATTNDGGPSLSFPYPFTSSSDCNQSQYQISVNSGRRYQVTLTGLQPGYDITGWNDGSTGVYVGQQIACVSFNPATPC